jgi:Ferritin-like domain
MQEQEQEQTTIDGPSTRAGFLKGAAVAGAGAAGLAALPATSLANGRRGRKHGLTKRDLEILGAAQIAEALAVTTYTNIINTAPFFKNLEDDDQGYLIAARQEEMSHYLLEQGVTGKPSPFTTFFYPPKMFTDAQTTLNILVTLEDAFIAAYLVGVRQFSTPDLRVTAARIMGIESDHRTLARVVAPGVATQDGGPIETVTGIQKVAESVDPPNNNGYERTLLLTDISQAVTALLPFADKATAQKNGFDVTKPFQFVPFTPTLPTPLGDFHSFAG